MADTVGQKTIQPVKATGEVAPAAKRQPTQQQIQTATLLRSMGIRPNNPKQLAAKAAEPVSQYAASKSGDYSKNYDAWVQDSLTGPNWGGTEADTGSTASWSGAFKDAHPFDPSGDLYWENRGGAPSEANSGNPGDNYVIKDKTATDNGFGFLIDLGMAAVTGGAGSFAPGIGGTLGLSGASGALANAAGQQLLTTGKLNPKGLVAAGIASPITSTLTGVGINPAIARAATSLATGAITGRDPRSSLLSALIGSVSTGNPAANSFVKALLTSLVPAKKKGK